MSNEYASICGITKEELLTALANEVRNMAQTLNVSESTVLARLKKKYDGYHLFSARCDLSAIMISMRL